MPMMIHALQKCNKVVVRISLSIRFVYNLSRSGTKLTELQKMQSEWKMLKDSPPKCPDAAKVRTFYLCCNVWR